MTHPFGHLTNGYIRNPSTKLRIAILGAPGSGKSTLAAGLLYFCKLFNFKVDHVPEVAKWHIYKGTDFHQKNFEHDKFIEQKDLENIYPDELEILIFEAPLIISAIYARFYWGEKHPTSREMFDLAQRHKDRYGHYFVTRKLTAFETFGRNENEEQANHLHVITLKILEELQLNYTVINKYDDHIPLQILSMVGAIAKKIETPTMPMVDEIIKSEKEKTIATVPPRTVPINDLPEMQIPTSPVTLQTEESIVSKFLFYQ